jgi:hypothetical protein
MNIFISDVTQSVLTTDKKIKIFSNPKRETTNRITKYVYGVILATGERIFNPDFRVDVDAKFS